MRGTRALLASLALVAASFPATVLAQLTAPSIASRSGHVLALRNDGAVFSWGSDYGGAMATGRTLYSSTPSVIPNLPPIKDVATTSDHVLAVDQNGRVWAWGDNFSAQLGVRVQRRATVPGRVTGLSDVQAVAAGGVYSVALKTDGTVWRWGNTAVPVGPYVPPSPEPARVTGLDSVVEITSGGSHVLARRSDGTVWAFGFNDCGQLGNGSRAHSSQPVLVSGLSNVISIAATGGNSVAVTSDGKAWVWGRSLCDTPNQGFTTPRQIPGLPKLAVRAAPGGRAILQDGSVWGVGDDLVSTPLPGLSGVAELATEAGGGPMMVARATDGKLYAITANQFGEAGIGNTSNLAFVPTLVPTPTSTKRIVVGRKSVLALGQDGKLWTWGHNASGSLALGEQLGYAAPVRIAGLPSDVVEIAAGLGNSIVRTKSGSVWAWGANERGVFGDGSQTSRSTPVQVPIAEVTRIALGEGLALFLKSNGEVWFSGSNVKGNPGEVVTPTLKTGLPPATAVGAGNATGFAIDTVGALWAWGQNNLGQMGDGTTNDSFDPVKITGITGRVVQVLGAYYHAAALTDDGSVWTWGQNTLGQLGDGTTNSRLSPQKVPGLTSVVEIAMDAQHMAARRADGTIASWGGGSGGGYGPLPASVPGLDSVERIAVGFAVTLAMRSDGTVWATGTNCESSCASVGDGTFISRSQFVLTVAENGRGSTDTNDWFLDLKPGTPKTIPPDKVPKFVPVVKSLSGSSLLNYDASVSVRSADQSKTLGLYVLGLVPPAFLKQVPTAPGAHALAANAKADVPILVNLTSAGWAVVAGQISAVNTGVSNAFLGATGLLTNVNPASIPGARFCIGYGESATDMLKTENIRDFLALDGATSSAGGLPCLLSGVYVDGPTSSQQGSAVPVRAVVVGQSPTGPVVFKERFTEISAALSITPRNVAVSDVSMSYTPPAAGDYAFGARYGGDALNSAANSEIPLRLVVRAAPAQAQQTTTRIDAAVSSEIGMEVRLVAAISGNKPTGLVQFKRGAANEGTPVPVVNDQAVATVIGLGLGDHSFTASFAGDSANQASTSASFTHKVLDVASSSVALGSSANPVPVGEALTLTATVTGTNPTGTVQLREGVVTMGNPVTLSGGKASFALPSLTAGLHVFTVDYAGDATNPKASSNAVFQQVSLNIPPGGDLDGDGVPNAVETQEGLKLDVKDNDIFANTRLFAMQQYRDFLGREGDAGGVSFWASQLSTNAQTRAQMIEAYFKSPEFQGTASPVVRLYFAYFLRIPDYSGLSYWIGQYRGGTSLQTISSAFAGSAEFNASYGALSNAQFVNLVYTNVLGRPADAAGLAYWRGQLDSGALNRGQVMAQFSESPEYTALSASSVYVTMMYAGMLRRAPDASGFSFWVGYLDKGNSGLALISGFLPSPEYRARFLP